MTETIIDIASWAAMVTGSVFYVIGAIGLNRMPDVFTRMHAVSVGDTLGAGLLVTGMVLQAGPTLVAAKLVLIILVLLFTGSVATHALARAALQDGVKPVIAGDGRALIAIDAADAVKTMDAITGSLPDTQDADGEDAPSKP